LSQLVHFIVEVEAVAPPRCPQPHDTDPQSLRQLGDAALSAAHEIGNSLTPLMVNTELIVEHAHNDHIREFAAEVFKAARRIAFTLRRMRKVDDTHPVAYIGEQRMLDLRMVPPHSDQHGDGSANIPNNSLDSEIEERQN
jgi:hypothetical protein